MPAGVRLRIRICRSVSVTVFRTYGCPEIRRGPMAFEAVRTERSISLTPVYSDPIETPKVEFFRLLVLQQQIWFAIWLKELIFLLKRKGKEKNKTNKKIVN